MVVYLRVRGDYFPPFCCVSVCCMVVFSICFCVYLRWGEGLGVCFYLVSISCNTSNIGLCVSIYVSFMCSLFLLILCMWYCSNVFTWFPFFCVFMMSIVSVIFQYVCPVFNTWFEYPELPLLLLIACICSLYLVWDARPVCPIYLSGQSRHFI
jgi:hypothetical protein